MIRQEASSDYHAPTPPDAADSAHRAAKHRIILVRIYLAVIILCLPFTVTVLIVLYSADPFGSHPDMSGLTATSIGIIGIIVFYLFLYKLQTSVAWTIRRRIEWLLVHLASIVTMFYLIVWLGFSSAWSARPLWGDYELQTTSRSWIISVIVVGSITWLGNLFDLLRQHVFTEFRRHR